MIMVHSCKYLYLWWKIWGVERATRTRGWVLQLLDPFGPVPKLRRESRRNSTSFESLRINIASLSSLVGDLQ